MVPKTLELKGLFSHNDRYSHGVSAEMASEFLYRLKDTMSQRCTLVAFGVSEPIHV